MTIDLANGQRARFQDSKGEKFCDFSNGKQGECLGVEFYSMHFLQLRKKQNNFKMFVFLTLEDRDSFDFGWWEDAEVILINF